MAIELVWRSVTAIVGNRQSFASGEPSISADGALVVFDSNTSNLVTGDPK